MVPLNGKLNLVGATRQLAGFQEGFGCPAAKIFSVPCGGSCPFPSVLIGSSALSLLILIQNRYLSECSCANLPSFCQLPADVILSQNGLWIAYGGHYHWCS